MFANSYYSFWPQHIDDTAQDVSVPTDFSRFRRSN